MRSGFCHDLAADFTLTRLDGVRWTLSDHWTGCESVAFIPDNIAISPNNRASIWSDGVAQLLERSPPNVHYWFMVTSGSTSNVEQISDAIDQALGFLTSEEEAHWRARLHVAADHAQDSDAWPAELLRSGVGQTGFSITPQQTIRGFGSLADVERTDPALQAAGEWPWENNIAYVANEIVYQNYLANRSQDAAADTVVELWNGDVLEQFEDITVQLPDAATMAQFDTMEIYLEAHCPNTGAGELGNCGAWDYLAHLWLLTGDPEAPDRTELARFITTYHREGSWLVDVTPMLLHLRDGGETRLRWEFAPEWNTQPTGTVIQLPFLEPRPWRKSNRPHPALQRRQLQQRLQRRPHRGTCRDPGDRPACRTLHGDHWPRGCHTKLRRVLQPPTRLPHRSRLVPNRP